MRRDNPVLKKGGDGKEICPVLKREGNSKRICPVLKGGNKISNLALKGEEMDLDAKYLS
jgi:hypothetical protein